MKILPIGKFNIYNSQVKRSVLPQTRLACDTVSFSAKTKKTKNNKGNAISSGVKMGSDIYSALINGSTKKDIVNILKTDNPSLEVRRVSEIAKVSMQSENYVAYFTSDFKDDFTMPDGTMYLNLQPFKIGDSMEKLLFAMDVAHEYTHSKQVDKSAEFYKELSGGDIMLARAITAVGNAAFEKMDDELKTSMIIPVFDTPKERRVMYKYGKEVPMEEFVSKQRLLCNAKISNDKDFKVVVEQLYRKAFVQTMDFIVRHPENVLPEIYDKIMQIAEDRKIEELYESSKKLCSYIASEEVDAYSAEGVLAKLALGTKKSINIDCYPMYYEMLQKAFQ